MASANFNSNDKKSWYFGAFDRKQTIEKLQGQIHGTFLVRDSKTCPGDLVLSVSENSKVSHYIINKLGNRLKIGDQEFNGIEELLDFYKVHYLDTTTLIQPSRKDDDTAAEDTIDGMVKPMPVVSTTNGPSNNVHDNYPAQPSMVKLQVKALFDFRGNDSEDLPFKKGEILEIVAKPEENWWTARNSAGATGQIPVPYVEKFVNRPTSNVHYPPNGDKKVAAENRISLPDIRNQPVFARVTMKRVPSAYDPSALALEVGDIVRVTKMHANGQWEGQIKDRKGIFPFTHVVIENHYEE